MLLLGVVADLGSVHLMMVCVNPVIAVIISSRHHQKVRKIIVISRHHLPPTPPFSFSPL